MLKKLFLYSAGYTYSNLSRLFLRLFTGVMFLHLCVRQIVHIPSLAQQLDGFLGLTPETSITIVLVVALICSACIIFGLLMRIALLPPIVMMCMAEHALITGQGVEPVSVLAFQPGYPMMFLGIFIYLLMAGPGKISLDYIIGVHVIETEEDDDVLDKA